MEDRLATLKNVIKEPELDGWNLYLGDLPSPPSSPVDISVSFPFNYCLLFMCFSGINS